LKLNAPMEREKTSRNLEAHGLQASTENHRFTPIVTSFRNGHKMGPNQAQTSRGPCSSEPRNHEAVFVCACLAEPEHLIRSNIYLLLSLLQIGKLLSPRNCRFLRYFKLEQTCLSTLLPSRRPLSAPFL
jgi:hypothetical protein